MDPPGKRFWPLYKGRDGCRSPMQWDASTNSGFSDVRPWLKVHPDYPRFNVAAQLHDNNSLLNFYKKLIGLRRQSVTLRRGEMTFIEQGNRSCIVYLRSHLNDNILVALNFSNKAQVLKLDLKEETLWSELFSTQPLHKGIQTLDTIRLEPYQAVLYRLSDGK